MNSRGPGSLDEEVAALTRGADRDSLFMLASLVIAGRPDPITVRVRNLSATGMLAEHPTPVAEGAAIEVCLRNVGVVPGRVVWSGDGKFGVAFHRSVNPQAVRREVVSKKKAPPHGSMGGAGQGALYRPR